MFTQTLIHDLALRPRSLPSRQPRAANLPRSVLLAALVTLVTFVALAPLANAASAHKRLHRPLGTNHAGSCVLPTMNPWLYVATCQAGTRATANPVAPTTATAAMSGAEGTTAAASTQPNGSVASSDCTTQPDVNPWLYLEQCQQAAAASGTSVGTPNQSAGSTTGDATSQLAAAQPSTAQPAASGQASSCTTDPNNPWQQLEGGC
jgi:hypothetical protein